MLACYLAREDGINADMRRLLARRGAMPLRFASPRNAGFQFRAALPTGMLLARKNIRT